MLDRSPSENQTLANQVAQFLNIDESRITIEPCPPPKEGDRAVIHCSTDAEITAITNQWCSATMHFHTRIRYLVLHKDDYQRELLLSLGIWTSQKLVKPT